MRTTSWLAAAAAGALLLSSAPSAFAATSGTTPATVTITSGVLSIAVSTDPVSLGTRANTADGGALAGRLGQVKVTDQRGGETGWTASVLGTPFTSPDGATITGASVHYTAGVIATVGTVSCAANDPTGLTAGAAVVTATEVNGNNAATWNPTISVALPNGVAPNVYTAKFTHSVS